MDDKSRGFFRHNWANTIVWSAIVASQLFLASQAIAVESDKVSHFGGGAAAGLAIDTTLYHVAAGMGTPKRVAAATGLSLIPGLIIEVVDEFGARNSFSWGDFLADGLGAVSGVLAAEIINGQFWISASGKQIRLIGHW